jgi:hypothetical protein
MASGCGRDRNHSIDLFNVLWDKGKNGGNVHYRDSVSGQHILLSAMPGLTEPIYATVLVVFITSTSSGC